MSLSKQIGEIRQHLETAEKEITSLETGRKASSARARKSLQNIKTGCHTLRKQVTEHTKALPTKKRIPKEPVAVAEPVAVEEPEPIAEKPTLKKRVPKKK